MNIRQIWKRRAPKGRRVDPFSQAPKPRPTRPPDRITFHGDGWHYGPCIDVKGVCSLPQRHDVAVRRDVIESPLELVVDDVGS